MVLHVPVVPRDKGFLLEYAAQTGLTLKRRPLKQILSVCVYVCLRCFDAVDWVAGRASGL